MLPISPSNPSSLDLYAVLHLEEILSEVGRERAILVGRPVTRPTPRALGALIARPHLIHELATRIGGVRRLSRRSTPETRPS